MASVGLASEFNRLIPGAWAVLQVAAERVACRVSIREARRDRAWVERKGLRSLDEAAITHTVSVDGLPRAVVAMPSAEPTACSAVQPEASRWVIFTGTIPYCSARALMLSHTSPLRMTSSGLPRGESDVETGISRKRS